MQFVSTGSSFRTKHVKNINYSQEIAAAAAPVAAPTTTLQEKAKGHEIRNGLELLEVNQGHIHVPPGKIRLAPVLMQQITTGVKQPQSRRGIKHLTHNSRRQSIVKAHEALLTNDSHDGGVFALHACQVHSDCNYAETIVKYQMKGRKKEKTLWSKTQRNITD